MSVQLGNVPLVTRGLVSLYDPANYKNYLLDQVEVLVVAGGGSGGNCEGNSGTPAGGGGAGGVIYSTSYKVTPGSGITVTVGNGGSLATGANLAGNNGQNSVFGTIIAEGGGAGGGDDVSSPYGSGTTTRRRGNDGGSGGGSGNTTSDKTTGRAGQGFGGGGSINGAGGGGGAGGPGGNSPWRDCAAQGGNGLPFTISGSLVYYAGGGGGGGFSGLLPGPGGLGGGGKGARQTGSPSPGENGTNGLGAGGGGGAANQGTSSNGGAGGKGVVIVRYPGPQKASGGDSISMKNGYTIHTFNNSGTFTPFSAIPANSNASYGLQDFYGTNSGYSASGVTYSTLGGGSVEFDGVDDKIIIANPSTGGVPEELVLNSSDLTIFCAVYPRTPTTAVTYFTLRGEGGNELDFGTANTSNLVLRFDRYPPSGGGAIGSNTLTLNQWNIVAVSAKHGVQARFFVNNTFETVAHTEIYSGSRPTWVTIGAQTTNNGSTFIRYHNGYISQMMIYNRALDDDEILQNYNSIKSRYGL